MPLEPRPENVASLRRGYISGAIVLEESFSCSKRFRVSTKVLSTKGFGLGVVACCVTRGDFPCELLWQTSRASLLSDVDLDEEWEGGSGGFLLLTEEKEVMEEFLDSLLLTDASVPVSQWEGSSPLSGSETGLALGRLLKPSRRMMTLV